MALATAATDKRHLVNPQGQPFFILGVNYNGYFDRTWRMWEDALYDPTLISRDFQKAHNSGFNVVRLFVHKALADDISQDNFAKLDETLSLAQDHQLFVLLTLNDSHAVDLAQVAAVDRKIVERYKSVPTVLGYDLEDEPVYYTLAAAIYPDSQPAPLQSSELIDYYGEQVSRAEAAAMQQDHKLPAHLSSEQAYYYINGLRLFLEYEADVQAFTKAGGGTIVDFMLSAEAEHWHTLIGALDGTVEAWLQTRIEPFQTAGSQQLLTTGWSWLHFAALPANRRLDFQSYHSYPTRSLAGFNRNIAHLQGLQRAFPHHPITFGEFGWSNQSSSNPSVSQAIDPALTALYEAATLAHLRANQYAGGFKWLLNDVADSDNPAEANFGVFTVEDEAKPIAEVVRYFNEHGANLSQTAIFKTSRETEAGLAYRLDLPQQTIIGGVLYQDESLSWQGRGAAHCFIQLEAQELIIESQGAGTLILDPWDFLPAWDQARESDLFQVFGGAQRTRQQSFAVDQSVVIEVQPGGQYVVAMGAILAASSAQGAPEIEPNPGEHVLLLGDFENYVDSALAYIRHFSPDFSFAADEVGGRWPFVSVIAPPEVISDETLDDIRGMGATLVERVVGDSVPGTKTLLDDMARRGQRFLTASSGPPQEEPPPDDEPGPSDVELYKVQPGDTLGKIARQLYGEFRLWTLIFEANRDKIANPSIIQVGMELVIPAKP